MLANFSMLGILYLNVQLGAGSEELLDTAAHRTDCRLHPHLVPLG
jgi:hypothetical protein